MTFPPKNFKPQGQKTQSQGPQGWLHCNLLCIFSRCIFLSKIFILNWSEHCNFMTSTTTTKAGAKCNEEKFIFVKVGSVLKLKTLVTLDFIPWQAHEANFKFFKMLIMIFSKFFTCVQGYIYYENAMVAGQLYTPRKKLNLKGGMEGDARNAHYIPLPVCILT